MKDTPALGSHVPHIAKVIFLPVYSSADAAKAAAPSSRLLKNDF